MVAEMSASLISLLESRRAELFKIQGRRSQWPLVTAWHSGCRPLIAEHFPQHVEHFDSAVIVKWELARISLPQGRPLDADELAAEQTNDQTVLTAINKLRGQLDAYIQLIELGGSQEKDTGESDSVHLEIRSLINSSAIPQHIKNAIHNDLEESRHAYSGKAYKACVVMLGAALEGIMLGTLQRTDALVYLASTTKPPAPIARIGARDPQLTDKIGRELTFEDLKRCMHELVEGCDSLGVDNIQSFRNAIHPWKAIEDPILYGNFDRARAIHYLGSLQKITEALTAWKS
jgi:hypothetical protein